MKRVINIDGGLETRRPIHLRVLSDSNTHHAVVDKETGRPIHGITLVEMSMSPGEMVELTFKMFASEVDIGTHG